MSQIAYRDYWKRKNLLNQGLPEFPIIHWWPDISLCPSEEWIFEKTRNAQRLLDFGAGDLKYKQKFVSNGFEGQYLSFDIGTEYPYDFHTFEEISGHFDAILCLDVIEHMPLDAGLVLIDQLSDRLNPGGVLILQTPNARCIRNPHGWDMTHLHTYNAPDLWSWLTCKGLQTELRRVRFSRKQKDPLFQLKQWVSAFFISRIIGADYADNLLSASKKVN